MPTLNWYRQRLSAMPPAEIPWRICRLGRNWLGGLRRWPAAESVRTASVWRGACTAERLAGLARSFPHVPERAVISRWPEAWRSGLVAEAEELLAHRASFFAFEGKWLGERIDWNRDYGTNQAIPVVYAPALDYRDRRVAGDVKMVWELGRMQHLVRLGQAWVVSREGRFAAEVVEQVSDWIGQCPYMRGIHWTSPMEAALRLISWTWAFHLIRDWPGLGDAFCGLMVRSIDQQLAMIDANYSRFSSANNHLVAEASGALVAASYWTGLRRAAACRRRARRRVLSECLRQNYPDGVNKEQSFAYQAFVWDLLLIAGLAARAGGDEFPQEYWDRLERMAEFLASVSGADGYTPNVGDEDGGLAVDLGGDRRRPVLAILAAAAAIWKREDFWEWSGGDEKAAWLVGAAFGEQRGADERRWPRESRSFPHGGYHVVRDGGGTEGEVVLVFDAGPLGWPATAAHGHADALAVLLQIGTQPVFVDPGTYSYEDMPRRHYYRATAQHNTLSFGSGDQAEYLNRFLWGRRPRVRLLGADLAAARPTVEASVRWWSGAYHRRRVVVEPAACRLLIEDAWDGPAPVRIGFCLHPQVSASRCGGGICARAGRLELLVRNTELEGEIVGVRYSPRVYVEVAAERIVFSAAAPRGEATTEVRWSFGVR